MRATDVGFDSFKSVDVSSLLKCVPKNLADLVREVSGGLHLLLLAGRNLCWRNNPNIHRLRMSNDMAIHCKRSSVSVSPV